MRRVLLSGLLASVCLAGSAQAAPKFSTPLGQIFDRVCLGNRPDFDKSLEGLEGAGYVEVTLPDDALKGIRKYESQVGETIWTVLVADRIDAKPPTPSPQRIRACTVSGPDDTDAAETELRAWLGLPKAAEGEKTSLVFTEKDGKRTVIPKTEASLGAAMQRGGFWTLAVVDGAGGKLAALVFASPAP
ncbi:MAG: hypothetical protein K0R83_204 [Caulobacter sp.]|jgi:hypothetical protein|nr:hypothetical protein [Caulobacter sp.]